MQLTKQDRDALIEAIVRIEALQKRCESLAVKIDTTTVTKLELELQNKRLDEKISVLEGKVNWFTKTIIGMGITLFLLLIKMFLAGIKIGAIGGN